MSAFKAIEYAYPSSDTAELLGHGGEGCWYISRTEGHTDNVWPESEHVAGPKPTRELFALFDGLEAEESPYSNRARAAEIFYMIQRRARGGGLSP